MYELTEVLTVIICALWQTDDNRSDTEEEESESELSAAADAHDDTRRQETATVDHSSSSPKSMTPSVVKPVHSNGHR